MKKLLLLWLFLFSVAQAGEYLENAIPPKDKSVDWMELKSGEWVNGEFKGLYSGSVEFDSDEFGLVHFDLVDVKRIITKGFVTLNLNRHIDFKNFYSSTAKEESIVAGVLRFESNSFHLTMPDGSITTLKENEIASIAGGEPKESNYWSGNVFLGIDLSSGNSDQITLTAKAKVERRNASSRFLADYIGSYTEVTGRTVTANNNRINAGLDTYVTSHFYFRVAALEYLTDEFQNIDGRYNYSTGIGYDIIHTPTTDLSVTVGPGYQYTQYVAVEADAKSYTDTPLAFLDLRFDTELSKTIDFILKYNMNYLEAHAGRYTHHSESSLEMEFIKDLDFDISLIWDRTQNPVAFADGTFPEQDDFKTIASVGYSY